VETASLPVSKRRVSRSWHYVTHKGPTTKRVGAYLSMCKIRTEVGRHSAATILKDAGRLPSPSSRFRTDKASVLLYACG
jgi:hypothetical protein